MTIEMAERAARNWTGDDPGPIRLGSDRHKALFSRMLLDTFNPYRPAGLDWPKLDAAAPGRLGGPPLLASTAQTAGTGRPACSPRALVDTCEPVMQEEGRHITFFVNWVAWHRRNLPWWRRPLFQAKILAVWSFLIWERIGLARDLGGTPQDNNFTVTGSK